MKYFKAIERRNWVLDRMYQNNFITSEDLKYKMKDLNVKDRYENKFEEANYFKEEVRKKLNNLLGNKKLYSQGYIVKTTINTFLQKKADEVLKNGLIQIDKKKGWRGGVQNLHNKSIFHQQYYSSIKNPFPKRWNLSQVIEVDKEFLKVIDKKYNENIIYLENGNKWLSKIKFKIGDIFL